MIYLSSRKFNRDLIQVVRGIVNQLALMVNYHMTPKETMEENMINQMMMQMAPQSVNPGPAQSPQQLDQIQDMDREGQGLPIPGDFLLKEGKYFKMKDPKELCWPTRTTRST